LLYYPKDQTMNNNNPKAKNLIAELKSTNLREAEYDPFMKTLILRFHTGGDYEYMEVDRYVYDDLTKAESAGRFFHTKIRGKFDFLKVEPRPTANTLNEEKEESKVEA